MPTVKYKNGKVKHFAYTTKGKIMAQMAAKNSGAVIDTEKNPKTEKGIMAVRKVANATIKPLKRNRFGISNLKKGKY